MTIETFNQDPNFSIVMPGGCNADCAFCFNKDKRTVRMGDRMTWLLNLYRTLVALPEQFYQISITGNEPMMSPIIDDVLSILREVRGKYTNILLTTNGTNLTNGLHNVVKSVDHINVSRHHYDEEENCKIFRGNYRVMDEDLAEIIDTYSAQGVDVSLNCVINDETTYDFINAYIDFAKRMGAHAVRFRKQNGDNLNMTPAEEVFDQRYPVIERGECPVCRTWKRVIRGMETYWKAAVIEPTDKVKDKVYELVYNTDGNLYLDWDFKIPYQLKFPTKDGMKRRIVAHECGQRMIRDCGRSYSSCGGSSGSHC